MPRRIKNTKKVLLPQRQRTLAVIAAMGNLKINDWAQSNGHSPEQVRRVLTGTADWKREDVRAIAVQLGVDPETGAKDGILPEKKVVTTQPKLKEPKAPRKSIGKKTPPLVILPDIVQKLKLDEVPVE